MIYLSNATMQKNVISFIVFQILNSKIKENQCMAVSVDIIVCIQDI